MIVDTHVYCFTRPDRVRDGRDRMRMDAIAWMHAFHHQPAWRTRDRAPVDAVELVEAGADGQYVRDLDFRIDDEHGRMIWTLDGEDRTKQIFPPALVDAAWPAGLCVGAMDHAGVDVALIHTDHMLAQGVDGLAGWVARYPDRLRAMAPVDEWRIPGEPDAVIEELRHAIEDRGLHALKFIPDYAYRRGAPAWDGPAFAPFWEAAASLGVPVFLTLGGHPDQADELSGYLDELRRVGAIMDRHPGLRVGLTHGFPHRLFLVDGALRFPEAIWEVFGRPGLYLEVSFPVRLGDVFEYPYREVWPALSEMVGRLGADRLMWGTDMPFQDRFCTYRQSRDWIERHAPLAAPDREAIMGGTAARLLRLTEPPAA